MEIKVLGTGCPKTKKLEESARIAIEELGISADITIVDNIYEVLKYEILRTPGLVVNGKVVHWGRIAGKKEIKKLIEPFLV